VSLSTDTVAAIASELGLGPVGIAATLLPPLPQRSAGTTVALISSFGIAFAAFVTAAACYRYDHTPHGTAAGPEIATNYRGSIYTTQPFRQDDGTTLWWIRVHRGRKVDVEGGFSSRGTAKKRARRIIDYDEVLR